MKKILIMLISTVTIIFSAEAEKIKTQEYCPVMKKNKVNKDLYVEHDGKKIYACCNACVAKINKEPEKYVKQLESQGIVLDKVEKKQEYCPVMKGNKVNKKLFVEHNGEKIYVCCKGCIAEVKKDPDKYAKQLKSQGIVLDKVE